MLTKKERIDRCLRRARGEKVKPIKVTKEEVFEFYCEQFCNLQGHTVASVRHAANCLCATEYNIRKCVKQLVNDGLLERDYEGGMDDEGMVHCYHGFSLSEKGLQTKTYKRVRKQSDREIVRCFFPEQERGAKDA